VVGAWPEHPGFHFVAGQGGYGIQMAPALARVAAEIIWSGEEPAELAPTRLR
jgi:D-arginine dehydrogenase